MFLIYVQGVLEDSELSVRGQANARGPPFLKSNIWPKTVCLKDGVSYGESRQFG